MSTSVPDPTGQQQHNTSTNQHDANQKHARTPIQVAIVSQVAPPPNTQNAPASEHKTPRWKIVLEFFALLVAIVVAAIYGGQLWVMNRQLGEMQSSGQQTDRLLCLYGKQLEQITKQANDTHDLAIAAGKQADASKVIAQNTAAQARSTERVAQGTTGQLVVMQQQLELTDRAWIKVTNLKPRSDDTASSPALSFHTLNLTDSASHPVQAFLNVELDIENIGHSAALNITTPVELFLTDWSNGYSGRVEAEEKRFCERAVPLPTTDTGGHAVFVGEPSQTYLGIGQIITDKNSVLDEPSGKRYILPVIIGCVDYRFQSSGRNHQTRFVYEMFHAQVPRTRFFEVNEGVRGTDIQSIRNESDNYEN